MDFKKRADDLNLHRNIKNGNLNKIKDFIVKYPFDNFVFVKEKSAVALALHLRNLEVYELLVFHGFMLDRTKIFMKF